MSSEICCISATLQEWNVKILKAQGEKCKCRKQELKGKFIRQKKNVLPISSINLRLQPIRYFSLSIRLYICLFSHTSTPSTYAISSPPIHTQTLSPYSTLNIRNQPHSYLNPSPYPAPYNACPNPFLSYLPPPPLYHSRHKQ